MDRYEKIEPRELKRRLRNHFGSEFRCNRGRGTAHHWIDVAWTNGPTTEAVNSFCARFDDTSQDDIMTDLWVGSQYLGIHRSYEPREAWMLLCHLDLRGNRRPTVAELAPLAGRWLAARCNAWARVSWHVAEDGLSCDFRTEASKPVHDLGELAAGFVALGFPITHEGNELWVHYQGAEVTA